MGTVGLVNVPSERSSPCGIVESYAVGGLIGHPVVDKGIVFHHGMVSLFIGDRIDTGGSAVAGGNIARHAGTVHLILVVHHHIDMLLGQIDVDVVILDDVAIEIDNNIENHFTENDSKRKAIFIRANEVWKNRKIRFPSFALN